MLLLFLFLGLCWGADLSGPWQIELQEGPDVEPNSCREWSTQLQQAYDEAAVLVEAALRDLAVVREKRPDWGTDDDTRRKYENWNRIDRNLLQFFGFTMDPENPDPDSEYMRKLLDVLEPMDRTLRGSEHHLQYQLVFEKPAIACGDRGWKYVAPEDVDPNDPDGRRLRDVPGRDKFKDTGAWVWHSRYLWIKDRTTKDSVNLCRGKVQAVVAHSADVLTVCFRAPEPDADPLVVVIDRSLIKKGVWMEDLMDFGGCLSTTLVHELSHLFAAWGDPTETNWLESSNRIVIDQQAVNANGELVYAGPDEDEYGERPDTTEAQTNGKDNQKKLVYGYSRISQLATTREDNPNCGPQKSVDTADAYAFFAVASLFSDWDWTGGQRAKEFVFDT
ncbi:hypothetical protein HJFPF1_04128 [Paramyrothecium foliicola]|nr:hypothetical protein HJFPF1_04128 [Paramyrothecium foliicola]